MGFGSFRDVDLNVIFGCIFIVVMRCVCLFLLFNFLLGFLGLYISLFVGGSVNFFCCEGRVSARIKVYIYSL